MYGNGFKLNYKTVLRRQRGRGERWVKRNMWEIVTVNLWLVEVINNGSCGDYCG